MSIVSLNTEYYKDTWNVPNTWLGISGNVNQNDIPDLGSGLYTIQNNLQPNKDNPISLTSVITRGRPINKIVNNRCIKSICINFFS